jgi:SAM-dependent methyltransferase
MQLFRLNGPFTPENGFAFNVPMPQGAHDAAASTRFMLFEDDALLGPPDSLHETIRAVGKGAFSVWGASIYLSTSDNSDPNRNGRQYSLIAQDVGIESPLGAIMRQSLAANDLSALKLVTELAQTNNSVFAKFFRSKGTITQPLRRCGFTAVPGSILEVGCGANPYTALRFLCDGAERYVANDITPVNFVFDRKTIDALSACLCAIDPELGARLSRVMTPGNTVRNLIVIGETPCEEIELAMPVEFITSTSVLEHVTRPAAVVAAFHRLLANGGLMWHSIDLRDHRDFKRPFDFLYQGNGYKEQTENRLRCSDWITALRNAGFEIIETRYLVKRRDAQEEWTTDRSSVEPAFAEADRRLFAPPFDGYALDDLATLAVQVLCRKR